MNTEHTFLKQLTGVAAYGVVTFSLALLLFWILKMLVGIRVPAEEELQGLDIGEHGMELTRVFRYL